MSSISTRTRCTVSCAGYMYPPFLCGTHLTTLPALPSTTPSTFTTIASCCRGALPPASGCCRLHTCTGHRAVPPASRALPALRLSISRHEEPLLYTLRFILYSLILKLGMDTFWFVSREPLPSHRLCWPHARATDSAGVTVVTYLSHTFFAAVPFKLRLTTTATPNGGRTTYQRCRDAA